MKLESQNFLLHPTPETLGTISCVCHWTAASGESHNVDSSSGMTSTLTGMTKHPSKDLELHQPFEFHRFQKNPRKYQPAWIVLHLP
jgi:hypothetical protein